MMDGETASFYQNDFGWITVRVNNERVSAIDFKKGPETKPKSPVLRKMVQELKKYFNGKSYDFDACSPDLDVYPPFVRKVLAKLWSIRKGQMVSYKDLAEAVGIPQGARAVGNALGRNQTPILIPCHRVIRSDGSLGGFTGGVRIKKKLLSLEAGPRLEWR